MVLTEVQEMEQSLPRTCRVHFNDPSVLHVFQLTITPDDGFWQGGKFRFVVTVPDDYNIAVRINKHNINVKQLFCIILV